MLRPVAASSLRQGSRPAGRYVLALFFVITGTAHFMVPDYYVGIMPPFLPSHLGLVYISGAVAILGGAGLLFQRTRSAARIILLCFLIAVFPANVRMLLLYRERGVTWLGELLLWLRLPFQLVLMWWIVSDKR